MTEPQAAVLDLFNQIKQKAMSSRPLRSDNKSVSKTGFVYTQLVNGMLVHPEDYNGPWTPMGGSSLQDAVAANAPAPVSSGSGAAAVQAINPKFQRAMMAAFQTSQLVDNMLQVTNDDSYLEYPTARHLSFAYEGIINGMQATPMPPIQPAVQAQIDDATKILYELDDDGSILGKTKLYKAYVKNATAYAKAKADYADKQAEALANPAKADVWPQDSAVYQQVVDQTYDDLKTGHAEKIERALDIIESVGVCMQDRMIAKARKVYDAWNLGIAGVPSPVPYSFVVPSDWADPDGDEDGWETLTVDSSSYRKYVAGDVRNQNQGSANSSQNSSSGSASFAGFGGSGQHAETDASHQTSGSGSTAGFTRETATNLKVSAQWGVCTVERPWLLSDLFYMNGWYQVNNPVSCISDGTIENQVQNATPLMPMIPMQFVVIRNISIEAKDWGSDSAAFTDYFNREQGSAHTDSSGGSASYGGLGISVSGSHNEAHQHAQNSAASGADNFATMGNFSQDGKLTINGSQIIGWLCDIVPACPKLPDPAYKPPKKKPA